MDSSSSSSDEYEYLRPNPLPGGPSAYTFVPESEWNSICEDVLSGGDWRGRISNRQQHSTSQNRSVEGTTLQVNNAENVAVNTNPVVLKPDLYFAGNDVNANSSGSDLSLYSSNALVTKPERNVVESSRDKIDFLKRLRLLNENLDVTQEHKDKVSNKPFKKDMDCQTVITGDIISLNLHNLEDGDVVLTPTIETSYNENLMHLDCISLDDIQNIFINQAETSDDAMEKYGMTEVLKIWKKRTPFLYDLDKTHVLEWPYLAPHWLPEISG
ncbi:uncharacterized protein [Anabrus simplex]|uniref:uncharacterized protein isoform X5 n=1 Tax=Anabrus simplex TaxID=316456 RepID=UPI0035A29D64